VVLRHRFEGTRELRSPMAVSGRVPACDGRQRSGPKPHPGRSGDERAAASTLRERMGAAQSFLAPAP
jgi:hypothetical protein